MGEFDWTKQSVLITGVCGTVGRELLHQLMARRPKRICGIDNNEAELFYLVEEFANTDKADFIFADIRDRDSLRRLTRNVDVILHTAALKHVVLNERSPRDAVETNVLGTQNVIDAAATHGVSRVLLTSSDKAVNPTNVMGTSKLMAERLMTAANTPHQNGSTIFASTRFGNVLGSRGSVIPLFKRQIAAGGPVTVTHGSMTRFIMNLAEAVRLVMDSVELARGGEVFVTKMPVTRIADLASVMIGELAAASGHRPEDIEIKEIGAKPGEKYYEELMNEEEVRRTLELDRYYVILPAFKSLFGSIDYTYPNALSAGIKVPYNSARAQALSAFELRDYLRRHDLLSNKETRA